MLGKDYEGQDCSLARALEVVGERWSLLIVRDAFYGVRHFNDFYGHLDIPKAVLSDRLNGLVEDGILERLPDPGHAGRHLYQLTPAGRDLWPVIHALLVWGDEHRDGKGRLFKHSVCGTALSDTGMCPGCNVIPTPENIVTEPLRRTRRDDAVAMALREPHRLLDPCPAASSNDV
jgi:DNA-binding HxlR family transcriptional regulator